MQNKQVEGVKHSGPSKLVLYFTGATNILYTFGGHAVTVYVLLPLPVFTLSTPSSIPITVTFFD